MYFKLGEIVTGLNADRSLLVESEKKKKTKNDGARERRRIAGVLPFRR